MSYDYLTSIMHNSFNVILMVITDNNFRQGVQRRLLPRNYCLLQLALIEKRFFFIFKFSVNVLREVKDVRKNISNTLWLTLDYEEN